MTATSGIHLYVADTILTCTPAPRAKGASATWWRWDAAPGPRDRTMPHRALLVHDLPAPRWRRGTSFDPPADVSQIVGTSRRLREALDAALSAAPTGLPILIRGDTGTGKELVAHMIHRASPRAERHFVAVNCAAVPESLLEDELFGHRVGAFTGASKEREGRAGAAEGGTLFLDEISELPHRLQAKLLRFVESGEVQRLGEDFPVRSDVRILAATNADLEEECRLGRFRRDLYYRICGLTVVLPALRERREDIPLLVDHFMHRFRPGRGGLRELPPDVLDRLRAHDYPGNVRELESAIRRCCVFAGEGEIRVEHLPASLAPGAASVMPGPHAALPAPGPAEGSRSLRERERETTGHPAAPSTAPLTADELRRARREAAASVERRFAEGALERSRGNVSRAARETGLGRSVFQQMMRRLGIDPRRRRNSP